ncbi:glycosyl hydrolase [Alkalihalobacillus sp. LMS39]|uniref:glycosyl hydrolase n=1 Tax=Alkalihalobacillus sp. LMS39 TaxID=2924032 RepID=UPI001FB4B49F|nr:glycosyl hydrolase [Alkalihalobacillus sp. LMS39]UOE93075.1 hypothetical protein MM271_17925 [Alkalihalobacillus sp. LMS39]
MGTWKKGFVLFIVLMLVFDVSMLGVNVSASQEGRQLNMADEDASKYTKELFAFLQDVSGSQVLFGQQHATDEGLTITNPAPRTGSTQSEVFNAVGDYPAVFGWDTNSLDGREKPGIAGNVEQSIKNTAQSMKVAHDLGGIITLSMHPDNFVTGGPYGDTTGNVVKEILPGGSKHAEFNAWLDNIAALAHELKDENGEPIPMIFRPFHEQTGSWFWWGASTTSPEQYKAIFRYTVEYLRDVKGVNNILYGFSPGAGPAGDVNRYLETYPGDDYVDIFGIDNYDNKDNAGSEAWLSGMVKDLAMISRLAEQKEKVAAFTEYGYSATGINRQGNTLDWYTRVLDAIAADEDARKISYMLTWANFGWPNNMYVPYRDIHNELGGDHELLPDFEAFHADDYTAFRDEIKGKIYNTGKEYTVSPHEPFMYVISPITGSTVTSETVTIQAKVANDEHARVTFRVDGSSLEEEMVFNDDTLYYTGSFTPDAAVNGGAVDVIVAYYSSGEKVQEETIRLFVKIPEMSLLTLTFDDDINGIKSNGTWPEDGVTSEIDHAIVDGDGKLMFSVQGMSPTETWQELKLELTELADVNIDAVKKMKFDALIPAGSEEGSVQGIVQLPPDWETKYGMNETTKSIKDLETVTVNGSDYKRLEVTVSIDNQGGATGIALSLVGSQLDLLEPVYIDNIELLNSFEAPPADSFLVDDFEGYFGDDTLLHRNYSSNGDPITLSLTSEFKNNGEFGLKYDYSIGSMGYAGRQTSLGPVDWSGANAFEFWMKHGQLEGNHLTVQIRIGDVSFEKNLELMDAHEGVVTIPFSEFAPAAWENKAWCYH